MRHTHPDSPQIPEYVDDRDLARLTPLGRPHWQALRYHGGGPPFRKIGRRVVYRWVDVVAWIEAQPANVGRKVAP
jgi:hypothetical protein